MATATTMVHDAHETAPAMPAPGKRRWRWLLLGCLVSCAVLLAGWIVTRRSAPAVDPVAGQWIAAEARTVATTVNATGTVKLKTGAEVRVGAQLSGIVRRLNVTVGSTIREGDVIAEIDSRPVMARIDQAQSQLAQTQVALAKAHTDFTRSQKLYDAGLIAAQQFEDSRAALDAAKASLTASESASATARVDLDYVAIRAPIAGTIASVSTQQGETVAASFATPTFVTIIQVRALEVIAMVDEADIGNVHPGESATFTIETYPDRKFSGIVTRIAPVATIISGVVNYEVAISISHNLEMLRPDMTTNVNIRTSERRALLLPIRAVHKDGGRSFVVVQSAAGSRQQRAVLVGPRLGEDVEVTRGLNPGDRILLEEGKGQL
ncbi:MAG: efflux RND transporter periplasmic adaptor subunit [Acidobacteriota bacterium]|nr:efflux RND transporter periplasmic adaptor subunit [Acidobacteriota bacterium]